MLARLQRRLAQSKVGVRSSGDDDNVDSRVLDQLLSGTVRLHAGVILLRIIVGLGGALHDRIELELRDLRHERNVEDFGTEAVANDTDVVSLGGHGELIGSGLRVGSYEEVGWEGYLYKPPTEM